MSQPIEEGKSLQGNVLTFAAQRSCVFQKLDKFSYGSNDRREFCVEKVNAEDDVTFVIANVFFKGAGAICWNCSTGFLPGRIILQTTSDLQGTNVLRNAHLQLGAMGLSASAMVCMDSSSHVARLTVTNGISARAGVKASSIVGTLVKDGAGTLVLPLLEKPQSNTGTLRVEAGHVKILASDSFAYLGNLELWADTKITLPASGLKVDGFSAQAGVTITGPGTLTVPFGTDLSKVTLEAGASIRIGGADVPMTWNLPATNVVGVPALWIDASRKDSLTLETSSGHTYVRRIDDVRGAEHFFATNVSAASSPLYITNSLAEKMPYIRIYMTSQKTAFTNTPTLVWDREITGIRAVFMMQRVASTGYAGCDLLGSYKRLGDFARPSGLSYNGPIVWSSSPCAAVLKGVCYQDGIKYNVTDGYRLMRSVVSITGVAGGDLPTLTEIHVAEGGAAADCWGFDAATTAHGVQEICECIVYTNELTEIERLQVAGYLMRKWKHEEPAWTHLAKGSTYALPGNGMVIDVETNKTMAALSIADGGSFTKTGAGSLELGSYVHADGTLDVKAGTMVVASGLSSDAVPTGSIVHVDAAYGVTWSEVVANGDQRVSAWADCSGGAYSFKVFASQTNYPTLKAVAALGGRNVVDMGPQMSWPDFSNVSTHKASRALRLKKGSSDTNAEIIGSLRTGFWMMGSAQGGGSLLGSDAYGFNDTACGLIRAGSSYANPLLRNSSDYKNGHTDYFDASKSVFRVNGVPVRAEDKNALSGGYDVVSFGSIAPFGLNSMCANHYHVWAGGMALGELLLYRDKLATQTVARVEQYLAQKWFAAESSTYPQAKANAVNVAKDATLRLKGDYPLVANALSGGGTIEGDVVLSSAATFEVSSDAMGGLTVTGLLDLSAGGVVRVCGDERAIEPGRYLLLSAGSLKAGSWQVSCGKGRQAKLVQSGSALYLDVSEPGTVLIMR